MGPACCCSGSRQCPHSSRCGLHASDIVCLLCSRELQAHYSPPSLGLKQVSQPPPDDTLLCRSVASCALRASSAVTKSRTRISACTHRCEHAQITDALWGAAWAAIQMHVSLWILPVGQAGLIRGYREGFMVHNTLLCCVLLLHFSHACHKVVHTVSMVDRVPPRQPQSVLHCGHYGKAVAPCTGMVGCVQC